MASSAALVTTNPLWVGLASAVLLRERPAPAALAGIALTVAGSVLIFAADSGGSETTATNPLLGNALALAGAISASGYLLVGRALRARISLIAYVWLAYTVAAMLLGAAVAASGSSLAAVSAPAWAIHGIACDRPAAHRTHRFQLGGETAHRHLRRDRDPGRTGRAPRSSRGSSSTKDSRTLQLVGFLLLLTGIFVAARGEKSREPEH